MCGLFGSRGDVSLQWSVHACGWGESERVESKGAMRTSLWRCVLCGMCIRVM